MSGPVVGNPRVWRALGHPLRKQIRDHLADAGPGTSTTVAHALGLNTGTASYHLRVLADADLIEEAPDLAHGKERWWRPVPLDLRDPSYATADLAEQAAADERHLKHMNEDQALLQRLYREGRAHHGLAGISRSTATFTPEGLGAFIDDYQRLLATHTQNTAPDARNSTTLAIRLFAIPLQPPESAHDHG